METKSNFSTKLKDKVLMLGYNVEGKSVYTAYMSIHQYYDGLHPWDDVEKIKALSLKTLHGYIFNSAGGLEQEFESHFNLETGIYENGWHRDDEGVISNV